MGPGELDQEVFTRVLTPKGPTMFDADALKTTLELHEKSFAMFRWIRDAFKQGRVGFTTVHQQSDTAAAAHEWISRHLQNIPPEARPRDDQVPAFAKLFVSFLTTSYRLSPDAVRRRSDCGCWCSYCAYWQVGPALEVRMPTKKDVATAAQLKQICLEQLASGAGLAQPQQRSAQLLASGDLSEQISLITWANELLRRSEFSSQGPAVLALWRQFAWVNHQPRPKFKMSADKILTAEQQIVAALQSVEA